MAVDESGRFISAVTEGCTEAITRAVDEGESLAVINSPKGPTGQLASSIKGLVMSATEGIIVATAPHAIFQEKGAGPHLIPSLLRGGKVFLYNPQELFAALGPVEHPGNPATHFLRRAGDVVAAYFPMYLKEALP